MITEFPIETLPPEVSDFIEAVHSSNGMIPEYLCSAYLATASTLIGSAVKARINDEWIISPSLWIAIIGNSGSKKSPSISAMCKIIKKLDDEFYEQYTIAKSAFDQLDADQKKKEKPPIRKRLSINDATMEALQFGLYQNPHGLLIERDELLGFVYDLNKYRVSGDEQSLLSIYSGISFDIARKTSDSVRVTHPFLSMVGGIQPGLISKLLTEDRLTSGFASRLLFTYPIKPTVTHGNRANFSKQREDYDNLCMRLFELRKIAKTHENSATLLNLTPDAMTAYNKWTESFVDSYRNAHQEREVIIGYVSKLEETIIRIAIILECSWSAHHKRVPTQIRRKSIDDAILLVDYYFAQFKRVLELHLTKELDQEGSELFYLKKFREKFIKQTGRAELKDFVLDFIKAGHNQGLVAKALGLAKSTVSGWKKEGYT
jgi:hypothetical protein